MNGKNKATTRLMFLNDKINKKCKTLESLEKEINKLMEIKISISRSIQEQQQKFEDFKNNISLYKKDIYSDMKFYVNDLLDSEIKSLNE